MRLFLISLLLLPLAVCSQLRLAPIFSDNMVLQRDQPIHLWGWGEPGQVVTAVMLQEAKSVVVKPDSSWHIYFKKQSASTVPQSIVILSAKGRLVLANILIGDLWLCLGQSNMEWPMSKEMHFREEKGAARQPLIRLYNPAPAGRSLYGVAYNDSLNSRLTPEKYYETTNWSVCDSNTVKSMSAVGYYFAKTIVANENVPIGLINLSIGGAPIETFISREVLQADKQLAAKVNGDWLTNDALPEWIRERGRQNVGMNTNGYRDELGLNHGYKPGFAYASGIAPITRLPVQGILWYQGESNSQEERSVYEYRHLVQVMVDDYRRQWDRRDLPFYWVQLSSIDTVKYKSHYWPAFRDEQRKLLDEIKNGGMAVCSDIGFKNDVHPTDKKTVGERLARWALKQVYQQSIIPSGPLPLHAKYKNGKVVISFRYAANELLTADGQPVRGFSIDGKVETAAVIYEKTVVMKVKEKPAFVYYGWTPFSEGNLINSERLPASTFKLKVE